MIKIKTLLQENFKKGDKVIVKLGPHKDQQHEVLHVFENGKMNVRPIVPPPHSPDSFIKYKLGMVTVTPDQVKAL